MSTLDCNTPEGRKWIQAQDNFAGWLCQRFNLRMVRTSDDAAPFDFFVHSTDRHPHPTSLLEVKCRTGMAGRPIDFGRIYREGYLVTEEKLTQGMEIAGGVFHVPFIFAVHFPEQRRAAVWQISDAWGRRTTPWESRRTSTDYSCNSRYNGRQVERVNAFLPGVAPFCKWYDTH